METLVIACKHCQMLHTINYVAIMLQLNKGKKYYHLPCGHLLANGQQLVKGNTLDERKGTQ